MMKSNLIFDFLRNVWCHWCLEESTKFYNQWIEDVKATVPKERLLIFNVKQGWKPLCDFLGVPIPANNQPFPHVNDTQHFKVVINVLQN